MNFGTLKTRIQDVLGRTPNDVVYELVTSDVNNAIRVRSLHKEVYRHETNEITMPENWKSVHSVKRGDVELTPVPRSSIALEEEGTPMRYALGEHTMFLAPKPGQTVHFEGHITVAVNPSSPTYYGWNNVPEAYTAGFSNQFGSISVPPPAVCSIWFRNSPSAQVIVNATREIGDTVYITGDSRVGSQTVRLDRNGGADGVATYSYTTTGTFTGNDLAVLTMCANAISAAGNRADILISNSESLTLNSGDIRISYYEKLSDLSADTDTNDILTNYPQIYVYGALFHHHSLTQNAEAAQGYYQLYERAMNEAKKENNAALFGAGPVVPKVRSAP